MARSWLEYRSPAWVQWCPGCGNYGILTAAFKAFAELDLDPAKTVVVSGIGCSSRIPYYINVTGVHTIHGRPIPVATGIKLANPHLTVLVMSGDGDLLGIGAAHFVALGRRNVDLTVVMHDNAVYGLTKGQAGPTLPAWVQTKALRAPNIQDALNPLLLAIASGYTFVARAYAYHVDKLKEIMKEAIKHRGAAFIDVLQPCPTYNNVMTQQWYEQRIYYIDEQEPDYDATIKSPEERGEKTARAIAKAMEWGDRIPLGVIYRDLTKEPFDARIEKIMPGYLEHPPATRPVHYEGKPLVDPFKVFTDRVVQA
ncbi:MAG: 2-oxoacid:ferredoxin oxidoreductase subunit beta [Desulfurococcales archaeon]|nr:2-oxoacid:ferredoxin oxidoreductase subunit beta [Desulfurococcales archaeon]